VRLRDLPSVDELARTSDDPLAALLRRNRLDENLDRSLLGERSELALRAGDAEHTRAPTGQRERGCATDATAGAGDDGDPSLHAGTLAPVRRPRQRGRICMCLENRLRS